MSLLATLDATRICARGSAALADPDAWLIAPAAVSRCPAPPVQRRYSWWSLVRNPSAMIVTGVVGGILAKDAALRLLVPSGPLAEI